MTFIKLTSFPTENTGFIFGEEKTTSIQVVLKQPMEELS